MKMNLLTKRINLNRFYFQKIHNFCSTFLAKDLQIIRTDSPIPRPDLEKNSNIAFGSLVSDHMLEIDYNNEKWGTPVISKFKNFEIDPRNSSLHYAIQLFEGMKAYKDANGNIRLFRPDMNMKRLKVSAERICLPDFNSDEFIKCLSALLKLDIDWIPSKRGYSLYLRPTFISMTNVLGVTPPTASKLFCINSPVGPYFPTGMKPIRIVTSQQDVRSWPGGFGYAKLGANYGPTLKHYREIMAQGHQQILWLLGKSITEVGVMNFFVHWINEEGKEELITCPLDGTILPGVTRDSIITLTNSWGISAVEKHYDIDQMIKAAKEGRILEAFGAGTAAIIAPISEITHGEETFKVLEEGRNVGKLGEKLYNYLLDVQYGVIEHEWSVKL